MLLRSNNLAVGGQAVIEGVMMRSPGSFAVAVRRRDGRILVREAPWIPSTFAGKLKKWPFFRGCVVLGESLHNGINALNWAAEQDDPSLKQGEKPSKLGGILTVAAAIALALGLFAVAPHVLTGALGWALSSEALSNGKSLAFHLVDGVLKFVFFIGYILLISLMPDVRRLFAYHGAEHKAVHTYEHNLDLTVENTRGFSIIHERCGTAFLVIVLLLAILVFSVTLPFVPTPEDNVFALHGFLLVLKILLLFPIAGISYEILKLGAKKNSRVLSVLLKPGLWVQKLTTREPDDAQVEVALAALKAVLWRELLGKKNSGERLVDYANLADMNNSLLPVREEKPDV